VKLEDLHSPKVIMIGGHHHAFLYPAKKPETRAKHEEMYSSQVESQLKLTNRKFNKHKEASDGE